MELINIAQITSQWAENNCLYVSLNSKIESTNLLAKEESFSEVIKNEALALYLTEEQTHGRGRKTRQWISPDKGQCLLSSWSYLTKGPVLPILSPLVGLALFRATHSTWPFLKWNLKAPNDLYIHKNKVAGVLIETIQQGNETRIIIGIGFNIFSYPQEVSHATSLLENLPHDVPFLIQDWIAFLDRLYFEITDAVSHCNEPLNSTDCHSLLLALNLHPLLEKPYQSLLPNGSLVTETQTIQWSEL